MIRLKVIRLMNIRIMANNLWLSGTGKKGLALIN